MQPIAETRTVKVGRYTVRQMVRPDNPYWPAYLVFRGEKLIGRVFSMPDVPCCEWLEYQLRYDTAPIKMPFVSDGRKRRNGGQARFPAEREHRAALKVTSEDN